MWVLGLVSVARHSALSEAVQTVAFDGFIAIGGDTVLGGGAFVKCTYVTSLNEDVSAFFIWRLPFPIGNSDGYYFMISKIGYSVQGTAYHNRLSIFVDKSGTSSVSMTATMNISNLECSDEASYGCEFSYTTLGQVPHKYKTSSRLVVKARPKPPTLTLETESVHSSSEQVWVYEGSTISAKCTANLGRPGYGVIEWRIYRGEELTYITEGDQRVQTMQQMTLLPDDPSCTERVEQRFQTQVMRQDQDFTVACFVHNANFPRTRPSLYCKNVSVDMCSVSSSVCIINVTNEDDEGKTILTFAFVVLAALVTALIVFCKAWLCHPKKAPPKQSEPPPVVAPPETLDNLEELETIIDEEVESEGSDDASTKAIIIEKREVDCKLY